MPCAIIMKVLGYATLRRAGFHTMPCAIIMKVLGYAALRRAGFHTMPCAIIALATFMKPAMLAPRT